MRLDLRQALHCIYDDDDDVDVENGCRTHSSDSLLSTPSSIIFENGNANINGKCERALTFNISIHSFHWEFFHRRHQLHKINIKIQRNGGDAVHLKYIRF